MERPEKTPDGREESLLLLRWRKQSESEDEGMRVERDLMLLRLENTPEEMVFS